MKTELIASLPSPFANHQPDFDEVALAGHSRRGLVVSSLALNFSNAFVQNYSASVGPDPVDAKQGILTHSANSMNIGVPTLIEGTGLGPNTSSGAFDLPPCAPKDQGHVNFYTDLTTASFHFVATENGHMDFSDDCKWLGKLFAVRCFPVCKEGASRQCMRQFSAGITVAFLQDVLFHNSSSFSAALAQAVKAPVDPAVLQCKGNISCPPEAHQYAGM